MDGHRRTAPVVRNRTRLTGRFRWRVDRSGPAGPPSGPPDEPPYELAHRPGHRPDHV